MNRVIRHYLRSSGSLLGAVLLTAEVKAADLEGLTRLLIPTYIAHQFANVCVARDPDFLLGMDDKHGSIAAHVQHVKDEIIADIPEQDARSVLARAAETARAVALHEVRSLSNDDPTREAAALRQWCDLSARPFIVEIVRRHDEHREFERLLKEAKGER